MTCAPKKIMATNPSIWGRAVYEKSPKPSPINALMAMTSAAYMFTSKPKWIVA